MSTVCLADVLAAVEDEARELAAGGYSRRAEELRARVLEEIREDCVVVTVPLGWDHV